MYSNDPCLVSRCCLTFSLLISTTVFTTYETKMNSELVCPFFLEIYIFCVNFPSFQASHVFLHSHSHISLVVHSRFDWLIWVTLSVNNDCINWISCTWSLNLRPGEKKHNVLQRLLRNCTLTTVHHLVMHVISNKSLHRCVCVNGTCSLADDVCFSFCWRENSCS